MSPGPPPPTPTALDVARGGTCPPPPQAVLADILRSVLGERLFVPDPSDPMGEYLSPEKLVNKVLVRASVSGGRNRARGI